MSITYGFSLTLGRGQLLNMEGNKKIQSVLL